MRDSVLSRLKSSRARRLIEGAALFMDYCQTEQYEGADLAFFWDYRLGCVI